MRAAIFIDGAHLLKQVGEADVNPDYARLADHLLAPLRRAINLDLLRCYFYYAPPWVSSKPTESELRRKAEFEKFAAALEDIDRWQVRLGKLERRRDGDRDVLVQKRVDVLLSVDMARHAAAGHIQHAVLVAGDSDFIPAVQAVKESGVTITLWAAPDKSAHLDLIRACDEVQTIRWGEFPQKAPEPKSTRSRERAAPRREPLPPSSEARAAAGNRPEAPSVGSEPRAAGEAPSGEGGPKKRRRRGGRGRGKRAEGAAGAPEMSEPTSETSMAAEPRPDRAPVPMASPAPAPIRVPVEVAEIAEVAAQTRAAAASSSRLTPSGRGRGRGTKAAAVTPPPASSDAAAPPETKQVPPSRSAPRSTATSRNASRSAGPAAPRNTPRAERPLATTPPPAPSDDVGNRREDADAPDSPDAAVGAKRRRRRGGRGRGKKKTGDAT